MVDRPAPSSVLGTRAHVASDSSAIAQRTHLASPWRRWGARLYLIGVTLITLAVAALFSLTLRGDLLCRLTPWTVFQARNGGVYMWFVPRYCFVDVTHDGEWCHHLW